MLQIMSDLPANVVGVRAAGQVDKDDYEQKFLPAVDSVAKQFGEINLIMVFETDLGNVTYGAWMRDAWASLKHFTQWKKVAIVSDQPIVEKYSHLLSYISPAEAKGFKLAELDLAKVWVTTSKGVIGTA